MTNKQAGTLGVTAAAEGRVGDAFAGVVMSQINSDGGERTFRRVVVQEVIFDPSILDDKKTKYLVKKYGLKEDFIKTMPANTIIGSQVVDTLAANSECQYFFPFFSSHLMMPVKAGEHVWVFFEPGKTKEYGFWITRIHEPRNVEDVNHTHSDRKFHTSDSVSTINKFEGKTNKTPSFSNGALVASSSGVQSVATTASTEGDVNAYEKMIKETDAGKITDMEEVPRYKKRPGDLVLQGSNNALIVLGTDRTGPAAETDVDTTKGKVAKGKPKKDRKGKSGTVDIVVGRGQKKTAPETVKNSLGFSETQKDITKEKPEEGNPDFENDVGRIYLSMDSNADENFNIQLKGVSKDKNGAYAVIKVDNVRIIARKTIKYILQPTQDTPEGECAGIVIKDGNIIFVPSSSGLIKLGGEDAGMAILCQPLAVASGGTVTGPPMVSTIGATVGGAGINGEYAKKVVAK